VVVLMLSSWLLAMTPAHLAASSGSRADYNYATGPIVAGDLDVDVLLSGVVGRNALRIEVASPATGLSNVRLRFAPPPGSTASEVLVTVPAELDGLGAAVLDADVGIPLEVAGVWTLTVSADTPSGPQEAQRSFTLLDD
jgi:hypothetical protein